MSERLADEAPSLTVAGPPVRGRSCGSCTACCTQVPVDLPTFHKPANKRCPMQRSSGCSIYPKRPEPCRLWSCRWLFDPDTAELQRPDKSGVVIDCVPDKVVIDGQVGYVLQLWVDPKRPDSHRDPALRRYLELMASRFAMPALVRWSSFEGLGLYAPGITGLPYFFEKETSMQTAQNMKALIAAAEAAP